MFVDKMETWRTAEELGGAKLISLIIENTHSCYMGDREKQYDWGYGCNACPACDLRSKGFMKYRGVEM
jgi:7-cyano-7-deazaguanine synthase